jgi:type IV pilus assembly protein PilE
MQMKQRGVTLMELMVVVVVVGILAAIAYPSYREQVRRSNRTEAKVALEQTAAALEKCYTRYMTYADFTNCPTANTLNTAAGFTTPEGNYRITGTLNAATPLTFTLIATPLAGQATDAQCMQFLLNEAGQRTVTGSAAATPATCW